MNLYCGATPPYGFSNAMDPHGTCSKSRDPCSRSLCYLVVLSLKPQAGIAVTIGDGLLAFRV